MLCAFQGDHLLRDELCPAVQEFLQLQLATRPSEAIGKAVHHMVDATDLVASDGKSQDIEGLVEISIDYYRFSIKVLV